MSIDQVLYDLIAIQTLIDDEKEQMKNGVYVDLCDAMQKVYKHAKALKPGGDGSDEEDEEEEEEEEEGEEEDESDEEEEEYDVERDTWYRERYENYIEINELADLWGWQFDFGRPGAVLELEGLIWNIVEDTDPTRVCAAVRVLNRAVKGSKPDDPADAERILEWKEKLVAERAIKACAEILAGKREFPLPDNDESYTYSILCNEILELFMLLGEGDALFRTKLLRNGALESVKVHYRFSAVQRGRMVAVLEMLQQR